MIVSAVSVNMMRQGFTNWNNVAERERKQVSNKPNCSVSYSNENSINTEEQKMFDVINEWKLFCHQQILNGKLDVIV